ncbi:myrosinase-binding protein 2-like [Raphanus sativus]|uniref:Myrosinase-binding protein 2-like n=1 Tax=Raphanus sativus TaxID=3726 RepID=A0A9W3BQT0_RAPSA|nr:myrosinase-binding protein 2-like [Raphanus sativus]XP_056841585.1 myrosinase-binding protein 2-like [Raphanus sativus]
METMSEKVGAVGGNKGGPFDDGVYDGVKKITVGKDWDCVSYIKIEYEKDGKFETREHGTIRGELQEFSVDYPNEYITSVGGSYERDSSYGAVLIKSLRFKTSHGRTSPILGHTTLFGNPDGREFLLEGKDGGKLLGFHGRSGQALDAIGPHFFAVKSPLKHFNREGGNGGSAWDDGAFDGVRKILVGRGGKSVSYVRFEYAKGQGMVPHVHGKRQEVPQEFVVDYPNEHITSVEGTIDGYLTSLRFKTSKGRTSPAFGNVAGRKFVFEEKDLKLVGFCGRSGDAIDAIGAHFAPLPPPPPPPAPAPAPAPTPAPAPAPTTTTMGPLGGNKGDTFDDGILDGVKKITIAADEYSITYIKIEYEKNGKAEVREHGTNRGELKEFSVPYPAEYITAVGGSYKHIFSYDTTLITSIYFTTSKGFTSPLFGEMKGTEFEFKGENGGKLVGFHGRGGYAIDAIGAHFAASTTSSPSSLIKVEAVGGKGEDTFDDGGAFDHVRKVFVGQGNSGVAYIKFEYEKDGRRVTHEHGKETSLGTEEFEVGQGDDITSVKVYYDKLFGSKTEIITSLTFKTLKGITSQPFGMTSENFSLLEGGKITGFHGSSTDVLHSLGAYTVACVGSL